MTGPEHYRAAEEDVAAMNGKSPAGVQSLLARAQVHATLALAAATAMGIGDLPADDWDAWRHAAATRICRCPAVMQFHATNCPRTPSAPRAHEEITP